MKQFYNILMEMNDKPSDFVYVGKINNSHYYYTVFDEKYPYFFFAVPFKDSDGYSFDFEYFDFEYMKTRISDYYKNMSPREFLEEFKDKITKLFAYTEQGIAEVGQKIAMKVFSVVPYIVLDLLKRIKTSYLKFSPTDEKKFRIYLALCKKFNKKLNWNIFEDIKNEKIIVYDPKKINEQEFK